MSGEKERINQETGISGRRAALARKNIASALREYLSSDEGRRDYAEWQKAHGKP